MPIRQSGRTCFASSGRISGSGLAIARMIGRSAIRATISGVRTPPVDRPRKTSAPAITSASVRALGVLRVARLVGVELVAATLVDDALAVEDEDVAAVEAKAHLQVEAGDRGGAGAGAHQLHLARCPCRRCVRPFSTAAAATIAVPCWSSWNTGIFIRSRSFFSM